MPTINFDTVEFIDRKEKENVHLVMSKSHRDKAKTALKDKDGFTPTDKQLAEATIVEAGLAVLPSSFSLVTPPIRNQGGEGSCVGFGVGYHLLSIEWYYRKLAAAYSNSTNIMSPKYLFDMITTHPDTCNGSVLQYAMNFIKNSGCVIWDTMPYTDLPCTPFVPTAPQAAEAAIFKIGNYATVLSTDIQGIKNILSQNHALAFMWGPDNTYCNVGVKTVFKSFDAAGSIGAHVSAIVGWDDSINAFKIANSWSTGWCDNGYGWIDYQFLAQNTTGLFFCNDSFISPILPVANAGFDRNVTTTTATLDGTGSTSANGSITAYLWTQVSGPNTAVMGNSTGPVNVLTGLITGSYVFNLRVTDSTTAIANDNVSVVCNLVAATAIVLTGSKVIVRGTPTHPLSWTMAGVAGALGAEIQFNTTQPAWSVLRAITPVTGSFTVDSTTKRQLYHYRIKVTKADGSATYSNVFDIQN